MKTGTVLYSREVEAVYHEGRNPNDFILLSPRLLPFPLLLPGAKESSQ